VALALTALALQLALTLGHTHAGEIEGQYEFAAHAEHAAQPDEASHQRHTPGQLCPDCFVLAQAATGLTATPPTMPVLASVGVPLAVLHILPDTPARRCAGFRPRAPPHS
jgi:hypothetical protein